MKLIFTTLFIIWFSAAFGQTKISGKITDNNGNSLPLANVILLNTYDGTSADADGNFSFTTSESGSQIVVVRSMGFREYQQTITLSGKPVSLNIVLQEMINELKAVTISAGSFTASDETRRTVFKALDIATTAGATADIAGALNTLSGTQKVGESGKLFVRGGDGNETRTFIDGVAVLNAYGASAPNTPSRGRFLPFMFKGTSFSTGGYSSEYGQALSGVLALESKDKAQLTRTDIGLLSVGGDVAHTQVWNTGSVAAKIQYTNIKPYFGLINQRVDWKNPPSSIEAVAAFSQKVGESGMLKVHGNFNNANISMYNHDIDDYNVKQLYDLTNNYRYLNASYKDVLNKNWLVRSGVSYTDQQNNAKVDAARVNEREQGIHAKTVFLGSLSDKVELKTGAEVIGRSYNQTFNETFSRKFEEVIGASFVEADIYTSNNFITRAGARAEYNSLLQKISVDPRLSLAYKAGTSGQVSLAYGHFRQSVKNELLRFNKNLQSEKAAHYILNYQRIENNKTFRIETYYKVYNDLAKYNNTDFSDLNNRGKGYARGVEFFWRDNESIKNADYWISYSFLDSKRNYLNYPVSAVPSFASKHNFSAVYKHFVVDLKSQLGFTYSYTSGRPYNNPNKKEFNGDRTPFYSDLSFNWSYLPKPNLIVYFSCTNLLGRNNIFGYEYSNKLNDNDEYASRAIRQPAKRFLFIGIFYTLSKDKSTSQLPSL
jgi:hypothetical protein